MRLCGGQRGLGECVCLLCARQEEEGGRRGEREREREREATLETNKSRKCYFKATENSIVRRFAQASMKKNGPSPGFVHNSPRVNG